MTERVVEIFDQASKFWQTNRHDILSPLATKHIEAVLKHAREYPQAVIERATQLDAAINRFNQQRATDGFESFEVNSRKLAEEILEPEEALPQLSELPRDKASRTSFFAGLEKLIRHQYYTFLDKQELEDPNQLITCLLVDGYGFALRAKRVIEHKRTVGKDDLIIVNALCEMVQPGTLQTEMYFANWFKPDYGLSPEFCGSINQQLGDLKP